MSKTKSIQERLVLPVSKKDRVRTLLAHLWRCYDHARISMGRSHEAVVLKAAISLLGLPNDADMKRSDKNSAMLINETRDYLSARRAIELKLYRTKRGLI